MSRRLLRPAFASVVPSCWARHRHTAVSVAAALITSQTRGCATFAGIHDAPLQVELLEEDDEHSGGSAGGVAGDHSHHGPGGESAAFEDVETVDNFARARVLNFVRRMMPTASERGPEASSFGGDTAGGSSGGGGTSTEAASYFDIREVSMFGTSESLFHARLRLPLPAEYGERVAEGIGQSSRDAEALASMHAEHIVNALGLQLYGLPSSQARYAEQRRREGSWAPLPGEAPRDGRTPSPPPLQRLQLPPDTKGKDRFTLCCRGTLGSSLSLTVASPNFIDTNATRRFKTFCLSHGIRNPSRLVVNIRLRDGADVRPPSVVRSARKGSAGYSQLQSDSSAADAVNLRNNEWFLCQIRIPGLQRSQEQVTACGKAPDLRTAYTLACMHAELLMDAMGIALFTNAAQQEQHSLECARVGRWAVRHPDEALSAPPSSDYRNIPPLQFTDRDLSAGNSGDKSVASGDATMSQSASSGGNGDGATADTSAESLQAIAHAKALEAVTGSNINISFVDPSALPRLGDYLRRVQDAPEKMTILDPLNELTLTRSATLCQQTGAVNFFMDKFGMGQNATFRASVIVPTPSSARYGVRVACGIASTEEEAKAICAMHALQLLGLLQIPVYEREADQKTFAEGMLACGGEAAHWDPAMREGLLEAAIARHGGTSQNIADHEPGRATLLPSPSPFKLVSKNKKGRIFFGVSREEEAVEWGALSGKRRSEEEYDLVLLEGQAQTSPLLWDLTADATVEADLYASAAQHGIDHKKVSAAVTFGANGRARIIVDPATAVDSHRAFIHTCSGARQPDTKAIDRLHDFLERNGRASTSYHTVPFVEGDGAARRELFRVTATLPVPEHFGLRVAVGEAPTAEGALRCAAMHAELILDTIGVRLYDHDVYQRRHAETARQCGRWAPLPETAIPQESAASQASPPAVRLEAEGSEALTTARGRWEALQRGGAMSGGPSSGASGDAALDLSRYYPIGDNEIQLSVRNRVEGFFHFHGAELASIDKFSATPPGMPHALHFATVRVPFPPEYGIRIARGVAMTRREAVLVCLHHAERMIDELGFPIDTRAHMQWAHHHKAKAEGRVAPTPMDTPKASSHPSSWGLKRVVEYVAQEVPTQSDQLQYALAEGEDPYEAWNQFTRRCDVFIMQQENNVLAEAARQGKTPRSGVPFEDNALDTVERFPINRSAVQSLRSLVDAGMAVPAHFEAISIGNGEHRKFLASAPLSGTPFTAVGLHAQRHDAISLAAMHYAQMAQQITLVQSRARRGGGGVGLNVGSAHSLRAEAAEVSADGTAAPDGDIYDEQRQTFTARGREDTLRLYAELSKPFRPLKMSVRRPIAARDETHHFVATIELEDDVGLKLFSKGEAQEPKTGGPSEAAVHSLAVRRAFLDLFAQVSAKKMPFGVLLEEVQRTPGLRLGAATKIALTDRDAAALGAAVRGLHAHNQRRESDNDAPPPTALAARHAAEADAEEAILEQLASAVQKRTSPTSSAADAATVDDQDSLLKAAMPPEHAELLAAFQSGAVLADVAALDEHLTDAAAKAPEALRVAADRLLNVIDAQCIDCAERTIYELQRLGFVQAGRLTLDAVHEVLAPEAAAHGNVWGIDTSPKATGGGSSAEAGAGAAADMRKATVLAAVPTLFGAVAVRLAALLRATPSEHQHDDLRHATVCARYLLGTMLLFPQQGRVFELALTTVAATETDYAACGVASGANWADYVAALARACAHHAQSTGGSHSKMHVIALAARRRAVGAAVLQALTDIRRVTATRTTSRGSTPTSTDGPVAAIDRLLKAAGKQQDQMATAAAVTAEDQSALALCLAFASPESTTVTATAATTVQEGSAAIATASAGSPQSPAHTSTAPRSPVTNSTAKTSASPAPTATPPPTTVSAAPAAAPPRRARVQAQTFAATAPPALPTPATSPPQNATSPPAAPTVSPSTANPTPPPHPPATGPASAPASTAPPVKASVPPPAAALKPAAGVAKRRSPRVGMALLGASDKRPCVLGHVAAAMCVAAAPSVRLVEESAFSLVVVAGVAPALAEHPAHLAAVEQMRCGVMGAVAGLRPLPDAASQALLALARQEPIGLAEPPSGIP